MFVTLKKGQEYNHSAHGPVTILSMKAKKDQDGKVIKGQNGKPQEAIQFKTASGEELEEETKSFKKSVKEKAALAETKETPASTEQKPTAAAAAEKKPEPKKPDEKNPEKKEGNSTMAMIMIIIVIIIIIAVAYYLMTRNQVKGEA